MTDRKQSSPNPLTTVLFVVESDLSAQYLEIAARLLPTAAASTTQPATFDDALTRERPTSVIWPAQDPLESSTSIQVDHAVRALGSSYLPIHRAGTELLVGPLFGAGRSCTLCWAIRKESRSPDPNEVVLQQKDDLHSMLLRPNLVELAVSLALLLLQEEKLMFTSSYLLYNISSRRLRRGTLTSTHECATCRQQLRAIEEDNSLLKDLIRNYGKKRS